MLTEPIQIFTLDQRPIVRRYAAIMNSMLPNRNDYTARTGVAHNDPIINDYHRYEVLPKVKTMLGQDVKPSYCFLSRYEAGTHLKEHVDRSPCRWTVSQTILCVPQEAAADWHLIVEGCRIGLMVGQAVLFAGIDAKHSRPIMPSHITEYVNVYFHFVPQDYQGEMS